MIIKRILVFLWICVLMASCTKQDQPLSIEQVKYNTNESTYSNNKLDSTQVIHKITKQKVQEVLDLATLYSAGKKDTEIDSAMFEQIVGYFYKPDSTTLKPLFKELDSFKVKKSRISKFELYERYFEKDTLNFAKFKVKYFDNQDKVIGDVDHVAQYVLVPAEIQFKKEFKFYFLNFYRNPLNDSISVGVTK